MEQQLSLGRIFCVYLQVRIQDWLGSPVHHFRNPPPSPLAPTPDHITELYVILAFLLEFTGFLRAFL